MRKLAGAFALSCLLVAGLAGSALAVPPGNNGTVKIEGVDLVSDQPDNNPHQGCMFTIEFRGFDQGDLNADWTLAAHPPSGTGTIASGSVGIGEDAAGGANDLDATVLINMADYDLSAYFEHPEQGFHIKLTVHADGSQGADTKFKVFWVEGCPPYPLPDGSGPAANLTSGTFSQDGSSGVGMWLVLVGALGFGTLLVVGGRRALGGVANNK
ncbi:MAG: hypothetical protein ABI572_06085 [Actinomycetota bacterium]